MSLRAVYNKNRSNGSGTTPHTFCQALSCAWTLWVSSSPSLPSARRYPRSGPHNPVTASTFSCVNSGQGTSHCQNPDARLGKPVGQAGVLGVFGAQLEPVCVYEPPVLHNF